MTSFLLLFQLLLVLGTHAISNANASTNVLRPECPDSCGNLSVPYPFGIGTGCFREGFEITCKPVNGLLKAFYGKKFSTLGAIDISLLQGQARVNKHLTYACYNESGLEYGHSSYMNFSGLPFTISAARNKFTAIGCDTLAYITGDNGNWSVSGCAAFCESLKTVPNGSCTGAGCCQTSIPENLFYFNSILDRSFNHSTVLNFNPCSYAFIADKDWFTFNTGDLLGYTFWQKYKDGVPLVMDWVVGSDKCADAANNPSYACRNNTYCIDSNNGYICNCSPGFEGNPYLENGCQDINECNHLDRYPCHGICDNTEGGYNCSCTPGFHGNDPKNGACEPNASPDRLPLWVKLGLGIGIGIVFLLVLSFCLYMEREKRKLAKEKERFFQQNGGILLYEEIKSKGSGRGVSFKIYGKEEMEKATNNFDKNLILGNGGHGTVYKGTLEGNVTVAIKKSKMIDESQKAEFVKEILILSQINHRNVVKLLGCCLEVEVPMLVYEFVSSGTLYDYIHGNNRLQSIPLDTRLRIAIESAEALAYLHSSASPPILHGDVKSSNILLDENYVAKVSDFGASTLVALDETQLATILQGTCGYLDPEYMQTYIFTEKSDVYSFGVVLLELLTRKKAFVLEGPKEEKNLASTFLTLMKEDRVMEVFDCQLTNEGHVELLHEFSALAKQCLWMKGDERPTMKEVSEELQRLRKFTQHPWVPHEPEELEILLGESDSSNYASRDTTGYYSFETKSALDIEVGR